MPSGPDQSRTSFTRAVPVRLAEALADAAVKRRRVVFAYIVVLFLVLPLLGVFLVQ